MIQTAKLRKDDTWNYGAKACNLGFLNSLNNDYFKVPLGIVITESEYPAVHCSHVFALTEYDKFIVRSSFVGEDSMFDSMAGRFKSVVTDLEHLDSAIIEVFASGTDITKNVLIQPYIKAKTSGEYFTSNPDNGESPTLWNVRDGNGGTVDGTKICNAQTPERFLKLSDLVIPFGRHLDIEWVIDEDDKLWVVQVRPITKKATRKEKILSGIGILNEYAVGTAVVVDNPDPSIICEWPQDANMVLVAPHTNREWEYLMERSVALITNHGTNTCHASIFAREIGLTAVIGTLDATKKLKTGDQVYINTLDEPGYGVVHKEM